MTFTHNIHDWKSWGKVYQSIEAWQALIKHIFEIEGLPFTEIEHLTPGTNAVFKVGETVIKIFAPSESGIDSLSDYETELFGLRHAGTLNIAAPKLLACGCIHDKYDFLYIIMEFIHGAELVRKENDFSDSEKEIIGQKLRDITDKMNIACNSFNEVNIIERALSAESWKFLPDSFLSEREAFLKQYQPGEFVFTHGDFNPDNMLVDKHGNIYIIDFADSVLAPPEYELAALVCEAFKFKGAYMRGFFGKAYDAGDITEKCLRAILMHDFGEDMIKNHFGAPVEITSLNVLRKRIYEAVERGKSL